jgi:hypothetical protein
VLTLLRIHMLSLLRNQVLSLSGFSTKGKFQPLSSQNPYNSSLELVRVWEVPKKCECECECESEKTDREHSFKQSRSHSHSRSVLVPRMNNSCNQISGSFSNMRANQLFVTSGKNMTVRKCRMTLCHTCSFPIQLIGGGFD